MLDKKREYVYLRPMFRNDIHLKKEYRLVKDILPPNI